MQTRWYIPQGRTLENTKIAERGHALHINRNEWDRIHLHLERKRIQQEALDIERNKKRYLKEGSKAMTKVWPDSIENIRARTEAERLRRLYDHTQDGDNTYLEYIKEREEAEVEFIKRMWEKSYSNTSKAKEVNGAFLAAECEFENRKQIEFKTFLLEHEKEVEAKWVKQVNEAAEEERREKELEKKRQDDRKVADRKFYLSQYNQKVAQIKQEREDRIAREQVEVKAMAQEIRYLEEYDVRTKRENIIRNRERTRNFIEVQAEIRRIKELEEKEIEKIIALQLESKHKIDCMIKKRSKDIKDEQVKIREKLSEKLAMKMKAAAEEEESRIQKAVAERDAAEAEKVRKRKAYDDRIKQERIDEREAYLRKLEHQKYVDNEMEKWIILNCAKSKNVRDANNAEYEQSHHDSAEAYSNELDRTREHKSLELAESKHRGVTLRKEHEELHEGEDIKFLEYADEVLELAKSNGRITYPIEKVIKQYKKENGIPLNEPPYCQDYKRECQKPLAVKKVEVLANNVPGRRAHFPQTDPNYRRCKCHKERLYR